MRGWTRVAHPWHRQAGEGRWHGDWEETLCERLERLGSVWAEIYLAILHNVTKVKDHVVCMNSDAP